MDDYESLSPAKWGANKKLLARHLTAIRFGARRHHGHDGETADSFTPQWPAELPFVRKPSVRQALFQIRAAGGTCRSVGYRGGIRQRMPRLWKAPA